MYVARIEWDLFAGVIGLEENDARSLVRYYFFLSLLLVSLRHSFYFS